MSLLADRGAAGQLCVALNQDSRWLFACLTSICGCKAARVPQQGAPQRQRRRHATPASQKQYPYTCRVLHLCVLLPSKPTIFPRIECVHCSCCLLADFHGLRIWNLSSNEACLDLPLGAIRCAALA